MRTVEFIYSRYFVWSENCNKVCANKSINNKFIKYTAHKWTFARLSLVKRWNTISILWRRRMSHWKKGARPNIWLTLGDDIAHVCVEMSVYIGCNLVIRILPLCIIFVVYLIKAWIRLRLKCNDVIFLQTWLYNYRHDVIFTDMTLFLQKICHFYRHDVIFTERALFWQKGRYFDRHDVTTCVGG